MTSSRYEYSQLQMCVCCSGIAHTGFDAQPDTIEAELLAENQRLLPQLNICNLPMHRIGAIVVAWTPNEVQIYMSLCDQAH